MANFAPSKGGGGFYTSEVAGHINGEAIPKCNFILDFMDEYALPSPQ